MWDWKRIVVFSIPFVLAALGVGAWFLLRKTMRTRLRVNKQIRDDPDINEWLVIFGWSRKVLYLPMVAASILAGVFSFFVPPEGAEVIGGVWLGLFVLNFLVDEYEMSVKVLLIGLLCALLLFLWLLFMDWVSGFLDLFTHLDIVISAEGYFVLAAVFLLAIAISWIKGLFYYVALTPNYMNVQVGPTESGEQVSREEYSTRIDTGDFLERMLGFGRIMITFNDRRRPPIILLVGRIGTKARTLEAIRGKLAVDRFQPGATPQPPSASSL